MDARNRQVDYFWSALRRWRASRAVREASLAWPGLLVAGSTGCAVLPAGAVGAIAFSWATVSFAPLALHGAPSVLVRAGGCPPGHACKHAVGTAYLARPEGCRSAGNVLQIICASAQRAPCDVPRPDELCLLLCPFVCV